jgi:hypothetical protein
MTPVATYPIVTTTFTGGTPSKTPGSKGKLMGVFLGISLGTGSEGIWVQERRAEPAASEKVNVESVMVPVSILRRVRSVSGLTWGELSTAMDVSRRTLHHWDSGEGLSQKHLQRLHDLAGLLERVNPGNPVYLRNLLLKDFGGKSALVMLRVGQIKEVEALLRTSKSKYASGPGLSESEFQRRIPQGVAMASYGDDQSVQIVRGKPLKAVKAPKPRKA